MRPRSRQARDRIAACRVICCGIIMANAKSIELFDSSEEIRISPECDLRKAINASVAPPDN
ncbi:hypothetical protein AM571_CH02690 [Rhizobium etli 8C-3]|uniref:Uncharacterized protein n=1 Tax=Rhizobium etli 8C-3 TaxID=538025 RepID=A0A1L5P5S0_RHIET|nr:hypothetical protein AM571_CH02690 [Rhizobium etli 8C-3]